MTCKIGEMCGTRLVPNADPFWVEGLRREHVFWSLVCVPDIDIKVVMYWFLLRILGVDWLGELE